jgi:hypothetical protein
MGLWGEVPKDKKTAMRFHCEALGSFLDSWLEYGVVSEQAKRLKRSSVW